MYNILYSCQYMHVMILRNIHRNFPSDYGRHSLSISYTSELNKLFDSVAEQTLGSLVIISKEKR